MPTLDACCHDNMAKSSQYCEHDSGFKSVEATTGNARGCRSPRARKPLSRCYGLTLAGYFMTSVTCAPLLPSRPITVAAMAP